MLLCSASRLGSVRQPKLKYAALLMYRCGTLGNTQTRNTWDLSRSLFEIGQRTVWWEIVASQWFPATTNTILATFVNMSSTNLSTMGRNPDRTVASFCPTLLRRAESAGWSSREACLVRVCVEFSALFEWSVYQLEQS
jgi:hypothetical protein